jgi:hypothetical protein
MNAVRFDPKTETLLALDYMDARAASNARFVSLVKETGSVENARAEIRSRHAKRRARVQAESMGLAYWPSLIRDQYKVAVDPAAFVAAERVLSRTHGRYGETLPGGTISRGGWDSMGHYGLSPNRVARMWFSAGVKDTPKFRVQVATNTVARKGDTTPFVRNFARGSRWLESWPIQSGISRKAVAALGRLSPELRHAAVQNLPEPRYRRFDRPTGPTLELIPVRVRDLNWAEVQRVQALRFDPSPKAAALRALALPARPAAVVLGRDHARRMPHPIQDRDVQDLCPSYPTLRLAIAKRIVSGESPASISGEVLSRKEAHRWLAQGGPDSDADVPASVCRFLTDHLPLEGHLPRDPAVAKWLAHVHQRGAWSSLTKVERHPDGRALRRLDVVDEIIQEDLDRGISTGVERAFERAGERLAKVDAGDHRLIGYNPFGTLPKPMALLRSPAALASEGSALGHCVGGYSSQVSTGQCFIISIASRHGRSTAEIRPGSIWTVAQHRGLRNGAAPTRHEDLLNAWLNRLNKVRARRAA